MDKDTTLTCMDCGGEFPFTVQDFQWFMQHKEYTTPTRCLPCRKRRKEERERLAREVEDEGREIDSPVDPSTDTVSSTAKAEKPRTEVTCSGCGKQTTVPFVPRNNAPLYCQDCYKSRKQNTQKKAWGKNEDHQGKSQRAPQLS